MPHDRILGSRPVGSDDVLIVPVSETEAIDKFCVDFGLTRGNDPGLSIVMPYYDLTEITAETILRGVIDGYFYPIMCGSLVVTACGPEGERVLNASSLEATLQTIGGDLAERMIPLVELAKWGRQLDHAAKPCLEKMPEVGAPKWKAELIPPELTACLRTSFQSGEKLALRVPFPVREKNRPPKWSYFDILMVRDGSEDRGRPVFIREGIIVSDIRSPLNRGVRSLVVVEDAPLATLLGDSETPAHTQWQKDGSNYRGKYTYGPENLSFVINSVSEIVRLISEQDQEADKYLLADLFSLPSRPEDQDRIRMRGEAAPKGRKPTKSKGRESQEGGSGPRTLRRFRVDKAKGGFTVRRGDPEAPSPGLLEIRVAYYIRNGKIASLNKYNKADFDLSRAPIQLATDNEGVEVIESRLNRMLVRVTNPDFRLAVMGFDENRDLVVAPKLREEEPNGDPT